MSAAQATLNRQVRLARRPAGLPKPDDWSFTSEPVPEPGEGAVLLRTLALSLDPAMRGWMNEGRSYIAPVASARSCAPAASRAWSHRARLRTPDHDIGLTLDPSTITRDPAASAPRCSIVRTLPSSMRMCIW